MSSSVRVRFYISIGLITVVGFLEFFSLSALLVLFNSGSKNKIFDSFYIFLENSLKLSNGGAIKLILPLVILAIFIFKTLFGLIVGRYTYKTAIFAKEFFQVELFSCFLHSQFKMQSQNRSSDWVRSITADCNAIEGRFFTPILVILGEVIPAISICSVLLFVNYFAFIIAILVFVFVGVLLFLFTNNKLVQLGNLQQSADGQIVKITQHSYSGFRELTIYHLQNWIKNLFSLHVQTSNQSIYRSLSISLLPKFVFELSIYFSLILIFVSYYLSGTSFELIVSQIAIFGISSMRLLPSVSKLVSHLQSLKHATSAVYSIVKVLESNKKSNLANANNIILYRDFESLVVTNLFFSYGNENIFLDLNLQINSCDKIAIVGASGSGKTTLINLILGLLQPTCGDILINNVSLKGNELLWWSMIAYVPQDPFFLDSSVLDNVMLGREAITDEDINRAKDLLIELGLADYLYKNSLEIGEAGSMLSGGQKQRIAIARALFREPSLLILDEATSAMDEKTQGLVMEIISRRMLNKTIIMITHRSETLQHFSKILRLPEGTMFQSTNN